MPRDHEEWTCLEVYYSPEYRVHQFDKGTFAVAHMLGVSPAHPCFWTHVEHPGVPYSQWVFGTLSAALRNHCTDHVRRAHLFWLHLDNPWSSC